MVELWAGPDRLRPGDPTVVCWGWGSPAAGDRRERIYSRDKGNIAGDSTRGVKDGPGCSGGDHRDVTPSPEVGTTERPVCVFGIDFTEGDEIICESNQGTPESLRHCPCQQGPHTRPALGTQDRISEPEVPLVHATPRELDTGQERGACMCPARSSPRPVTDGAGQAGEAVREQGFCPSLVGVPAPRLWFPLTTPMSQRVEKLGLRDSEKLS